MIRLSINGFEALVQEGKTVLEASREVDVWIPTLCYHPKISPSDSCGLCVVEIKGVQRPVTACNTLAVEGMEVSTDTPRLQEIRRDILQLILADHPLDCPVCDKAGECLLQRLTYDLGVAEPGHPLPLEGLRPIRDWPLIEYEPQRCITCMRCIKVCHEVIGLGALALKGKGYRARVGPSKGESLNCEFCGECVEICPTGALLSKPFRAKAKAWELQGKPTVCPYCPAGCRLGYQIKGNRVMRAVSIPGPPNEGTLCVGGRFGFDVMHHPARLITPYLRENGELVPVDWEKALGFVAGSLSQIKEAHGPDAIAGITSPRVPNEDQYAFQKFFRVAVGTHSVDSEARFSHLRVFKALELTCGTSGVTPPLEELLGAEVILVLGSDPTEEVPALGWKIRQATRRFDSQVIVANARRIDLMRFSVCPMHHRPYSEVALLLGIMKVIWEEGLWRRDFVLQQVSNAPALLDLLGRVSLRRVLRETGVEEEALREAASLIGKASSAAFIFGGDVILQRDGLQCVAHLANLALLTGHVNKPHCGLYPLYEKNNLQGLCDMGGAPEFLPGYQSLADARSFFEEVWGNALPHTRGRTLPEMVMAMESGEIKALLIMGADPLTAFPNAARWEPALKSLELLVVQGLFPSDTAQMAHCILPALSFAEREGAYTTLEHRLRTFEPILEPSGHAEPDWAILERLSQALGRGLGFRTVEEIRKEIALTVPGYRIMRRPEGRDGAFVVPPKTGFKVSGERSYAFAPFPDPPEEEGAGKFRLMVGSMPQHFGLYSAYASHLNSLCPRGFVEMHPEDGGDLGLEENDEVILRSSSGEVQGPVRFSTGLLRGVVWVPKHFREMPVLRLLDEHTRGGWVQVIPVREASKVVAQPRG